MSPLLRQHPHKETQDKPLFQTRWEHEPLKAKSLICARGDLVIALVSTDLYMEVLQNEHSLRVAAMHPPS